MTRAMPTNNPPEVTISLSNKDAVALLENAEQRLHWGLMGMSMAHSRKKSRAVLEALVEEVEQIKRLRVAINQGLENHD